VRRLVARLGEQGPPAVVRLLAAPEVGGHHREDAHGRLRLEPEIDRPVECEPRLARAVVGHAEHAQASVVVGAQSLHRQTNLAGATLQEPLRGPARENGPGVRAVARPDRQQSGAKLLGQIV